MNLPVPLNGTPPPTLASRPLITLLDDFGVGARGVAAEGCAGTDIASGGDLGARGKGSRAFFEKVLAAGIELNHAVTTIYPLGCCSGGAEGYAECIHEDEEDDDE
jgi:hypothetical protein